MTLEELITSLTSDQLLALLQALEAEDLEKTELYDCVLFCAEIRHIVCLED